MAAIDDLLGLMARLRDPDNGCPWDVKQTYRSIVPHTLEEAHEVAEAIERDDLDALRDELGDLLFQVVFYAQIAREEGRFDFDDVARGITDKMIRRHPHVFGDTRYESLEAQTADWEAIKQAEKTAGPDSALDGVPVSLPALTRAVKLQKKASRVGFDWGAVLPVLDKIEEEVAELRVEIADGHLQRATDELGDVLFALANLGRHLKVDPEQALRGTNAKFDRRFREVERRLAELGKTPVESTLEEMDAIWDAIKTEEKRGT